MKYLLILIIPVFAFADAIKRKPYNASIFQVGSIQKSILSDVDFFSLHGNCWRKMNGGSLAGTDLASKGSLPNSSNRFLRNAGDSGVVLRGIQEDTLGGHRHWISNAPYDDGNAIYITTNSQLAGLIADAGVYNENDPMSIYGRNMGLMGGVETRPKNTTVNLFVKVSEKCD